VAREFAAALRPGSNVIWYLECRPQALDPHGYLRRALQERSAMEQVQDFTGIRVFRYQIATPIPPR
jgi:hypothetical protein